PAAHLQAGRARRAHRHGDRDGPRKGGARRGRHGGAGRCRPARLTDARCGAQMGRVRLERVEVDGDERGGTRTLVLLHGFGADQHDLLPLARDLDPSLRVISLAAPIALEQGGRAWYRLQEGPQGISFDAREVLEAGNIALEAVEEIARESPDPILCGFSQGGGMALAAALERPGLVSTILALSAVP